VASAWPKHNRDKLHAEMRTSRRLCWILEPNKNLVCFYKQTKQQTHTFNRTIEKQQQYASLLLPTTIVCPLFLLLLPLVVRLSQNQIVETKPKNSSINIASCDECRWDIKSVGGGDSNTVDPSTLVNRRQYIYKQYATNNKVFQTPFDPPVWSVE